MDTQPASPKVLLQRKLHPSSFTQLSGTMAAIVGFILDVAYSDPQIEEMAVTSDGFVLARARGEANSQFLGVYRDLITNYLGLQEAARLSDSERMAMDELFAFKIGFYGPTTA